MSIIINDERLKVYFPHEEYIWISGEIVNKLDDDTFEIQVNDDTIPTSISNEMKVFKGNLDVLPLQNDKLTEKGIDDMSTLNFLHEASILYNLITRFTAHLPYTYCGNICIAINPYQWLYGLYNDVLKSKHMNYLRYELVPHVYAVSSTAYKDLRDYNKNQSILVSGESGNSTYL